MNNPHSCAFKDSLSSYFTGAFIRTQKPVPDDNKDRGCVTILKKIRVVTQLATWTGPRNYQNNKMVTFPLCLWYSSCQPCRRRALLNMYMHHASLSCSDWQVLKVLAQEEERRKGQRGGNKVGAPFPLTPAESLWLVVVPPRRTLWCSVAGQVLQCLEFLLACWSASPLCSMQLNHMLADTNGDVNQLINIYQ